MIRIICIGKMKDNMREISEGYVKRIKRFTKLEIIEIKEYKSNSVEQSLRKEAEKILQKVESFTALDNRGKQFTSEEFSNIIKSMGLTFVIGSHVGLAKEVKDKAERLLSISQMTLPHQFTRIILLEQIYRAFTILKNQPYNK